MYIFHINMTKWYTNSNFLSEFRNSKSNGFYLFETFRNADKTHSKRNNNLRQKRLESNSIFPLTDRLRNSRECRPHTAGAYLDMSPILPPMFPRHSLDVPSMFPRCSFDSTPRKNLFSVTPKCSYTDKKLRTAILREYYEKRWLFLYLRGHRHACGIPPHSPSALGATDDARRHKSATRPRLSPPQHLHVALGTPTRRKIITMLFLF